MNYKPEPDNTLSQPGAVIFGLRNRHTGARAWIAPGGAVTESASVANGWLNQISRAVLRRHRATRKSCGPSNPAS